MTVVACKAFFKDTGEIIGANADARVRNEQYFFLTVCGDFDTAGWGIFQGIGQELFNDNGQPILVGDYGKIL